MSCLKINEFNIKDSFLLAKEIAEEDSTFYTGSLDEDPLFTNIPLEKTINICTESIFDQDDIVEGLNKSELKE